MTSWFQADYFDAGTLMRLDGEAVFREVGKMPDCPFFSIAKPAKLSQEQAQDDEENGNEDLENENEDDEMQVNDGKTNEPEGKDEKEAKKEDTKKDGATPAAPATAAEVRAACGVSVDFHLIMCCVVNPGQTCSCR